MPALNFKAQFAKAVTEGRKCQTIRAWRKRPFKAGDDLSFFAGMRTKQCRRLRSNARCKSAEPFALYLAKDRAFFSIGDRVLFSDEANLLAVNDGFGGICDMVEFFEATHGLPFRGQLIKWGK